MNCYKGKNIHITVGSYHFNLIFVPFEELKMDGLTNINDRIIKVRDDLDRQATLITIKHELVHALIGTQGRVFQKKIDIEDMCEFVAWRLEEINEIIGCIEAGLDDFESEEKL